MEENLNNANLAEDSDNLAVEEAVDELQQLKDDYLRLQAEFDNYRKRTAREKMDILLAGGQDVVASLLPVLDDTDRALAALPEGSSEREGIELIARKLRDILASHGLAELEAKGMDLDTDLHEAVALVPDPENKGKVLDVVQKGYKLRDRVIRHAKCVVGE